jgi:hypothetical protein
MAGYPNPEFEMLDQLRRDGWHLHDMAEYESKIFDVVEWCRQTLGNMLTMYDADVIDCRWHGATVSMPTADKPQRYMCIFAFKEEADYTMLRLRWA